MPDARLKKVFDVSSRLFIIQGFTGTQIGQIAQGAGISIGAMYDLFASKRVILDYLIRCTIEPDFIEADLALPLDAPAFAGLDEQVEQAFERITHRFEAPLGDRSGGYTYGRMLSDAFDLLSTYGTGCMLLEANPEAFGSLFALYSRYRRRFYDAVERYVGAFRRQGQLRPRPDNQQTARYIVDSLFWWTMQIHYDIFEADEPIPLPVAKQICTDALFHAYAVRET